MPSYTAPHLRVEACVWCLRAKAGTWPCTAAVHAHNGYCSQARDGPQRVVSAGRSGAGRQAHVFPPGGAAGSPPAPSTSRDRATPAAAALRRRGCRAAPWHSRGASPPLPARWLPARVEGGSQRRGGYSGVAIGYCGEPVPPCSSTAAPRAPASRGPPPATACLCREGRRRRPCALQPAPPGQQWSSA